MSVASPPRTAGSRTSGRHSLLQERPMRHPDAGSAEVMTRRAWWLVVLNFLLPGSAQVLAGNRRLGRVGVAATLTMWVLIVVAALGALLWREAVTTLGTNWFVLTLVQVVLIAYVVLWVVLTVDTLRLARLVRTRPRARVGIAALAVALLVLAGGTTAYAAYSVGTLRGAFGSIFGQSGPSVPPSDGYYNILLLGADSGDGRDSMRFDSISVVSINAETGAVTITGIPRDIQNPPFSAGPMQDLYPDGFEGHGDATCGWGAGINQLMNAVEVCRDGSGLYPDAESVGSTPAVEATKDAAEGVLGIEIPYYVFVDMHGFADMIDALGGVDITVAERLPKGGGPAYDGQPVDDWAIGWIEAGEQHMDGDTAQWYARSRYTTNDWDRMQRQRQLQQAMLAQLDPATVLTRFNDIAAAGQDLIETDVPQSMFPTFVELALKAKEQPVASLELTPMGIGIDPDDPDYDRVHEIVRDALHPPTPEPES
ncbi:LCP family protein [Microbacterium sp. zg.Y1084]|uniref:LCP family protein n=1 Tax=Microbacterium sp. zg.Y1084 TaxID=2969667 RepID=UPI00214B4924|nr:LCP family protein [Microbacterium sp. zg.Y1084]MCR2813616.1 LCP family protein [Microbacterium sp. zg.Y1084]